MKKLITLLLVLCSLQSFSQSTTIVISQIYGGGGNAGSTYTNDFIELFNRGNTTVSLNGWSVQYAAATGTTTWAVTNLTNVSLAPGQYYLIQEAQGAGGTTPLPTPDATGVIAMSAAAGKVALVNTVTALSGACPTATIVDFVGFGATANCFEGTGPTPAPSNTTAILRGSNGCTDTDQNATDFATGAPSPRNTVTTLAPCGGASPSLSASALTAFGNVCINTTAGPNSFTITGTALTAAPVTVGAVSGYTYCTTSNGTYASSLSLTQPGGAYSQQIFVKFSPTAVQNYPGPIPVGGGGATGINVAASGAGINTMATVTTGAASSVTQTTATCAGTIPTTGCSAISAYGIEFSTSPGFGNGTGTPVASTNLSGVNFSSNLSSLTPNTQYYYHAYATNGGGTVYGSEQTFTTLAPSTSLSATALGGFGNICINTTAGPNSFTITGVALTAAPVTVGPLSGFSFSTTAGGTYTASLSMAQPGGAYSQQVFVNFSPVAVQSYNGPIPVGGGGATTINVAATGAGVNSIPTLTTGAASAVTTTTATAAGIINSIGCSAIGAYGIEYSLIAGFSNGTGIAVAASNLSGGNFSSSLTLLTPNTQYYYHAYATNGAGTGYGSEQTFTTQALTPTLNATALAAFGNVCINTTAGPNSFTINGSALTAAPVTVGPLSGFSFSTTSGGTYTASLSLAQPGGTYTQNIFVKFTPVAVQSYSGSIPVGGGGAATINVAASGAGVNTTATVTTGAASAITSITATCAGAIPTIGCSAISAYGIEYSTTNGFTNGTGTAVAASNLSGGNFSSNLSGLAPTTTYYYHAYATNGGGTVYGAQQSFVTATPAASTSTLTAFGNVCINTTAGPNSFTITGTNLTAANINVGALAGFTYSTIAGGSYTASLSLAQPGGSYSQQIFVKFTPVAVLSYNGNIPVSGGGIASAINVAASGAGINTAATVTTGGASAVTLTTATLAGSIPSIGCSAITAYGVEYSLTNGFANGTGITVAASNLSSGNFSSNLTGLTPITTYYYHAYATSGGGTAYGTQQSFTTLAPVLTATALTGFGAVCINTTAGPNSFTISSTALTNANINVGPLTGYSFATTAGGTYAASLSLTQAGGPYSQTIYVKFTPVAVQSYNGNIRVSGGGAIVAISVAVTGSGNNTAATVSTGNATVLSANAATTTGTISSIGCSTVTQYGIEYSGINGFVNGSGTKVFSTNISGANFTATLNGLVQGSTYYYKAFAISNGGTAYGAQQSFTTATIPTGLVIYSNPVSRGANVHFTLDGIVPGHYTAEVFNSGGQLVWKKELIIQTNFIDDYITLPGHLGTGTYDLQIVNPEFRAKKIFMIW